MRLMPTDDEARHRVHNPINADAGYTSVRIRAAGTRWLNFGPANRSRAPPIHLKPSTIATDPTPAPAPPRGNNSAHEATP